MGFAEGAVHEGDDVEAVVPGCVFGEEAFAGGGVEGVAEVAEDGRWSGAFGRGWMLDEAHAELVGGAFEAEGYHVGGGGGRESEVGRWSGFGET